MTKITNILDVEKHLTGISVVIFDLDDTLYPEKDYIKSGFEAIAKVYPNIRDFSQKLWDAFLTGKQPIDYVLQQENLLDEKENCLMIYRNHKPTISLYPGVYEMLKRISRQKKLGIITDGRIEGQKAKIEALGLEKVFDKIIITDELGGINFRKPNVESFNLARDFFGCEFKNMCYIGDNIKKDGVAPELLGMFFILFVNKDGLYLH